MRTLITVFILSLVNQLSVAQKNFEGKIIYENTIPRLGKSTTEIYFGNQKLKIRELSGQKSGYPEERITDFLKGIAYWINDSSKTYYEFLVPKRLSDSIMELKIDSLTKLKPFPEKNKRILGYNCTAYTLGNISEPIPEMRMPRVAIYMWYADSLFYTIDNMYKHGTDIEKATNGRNVGMGMEINIGPDSSLQKIISEPVSIISEAFPDSVFLIPAGYSLTSEKEFMQSKMSGNLEVVDTQIAEVRQEDSPPPPPPPPPPLPPKPLQNQKKAGKKY
ncbi:MAG: DUF4412 domain-containing protein [Bacteroidota bacterium]